MPPDEQEKRLRDALKHPEKYGLTRCVLCAGPPAFIGVFGPNPDFARRLGAPKGKQRLILYAVCNNCKHRLDDIEAQMARDLSVQ